MARGPKHLAAECSPVFIHIAANQRPSVHCGRRNGAPVSSATGHSRRYCHVRPHVRFSQQRTQPEVGKATPPAPRGHDPSARSCRRRCRARSDAHHHMLSRGVRDAGRLPVRVGDREPGGDRTRGGWLDHHEGQRTTFRPSAEVQPAVLYRLARTVRQGAQCLFGEGQVGLSL
jgi:hypothetical protein